MNERAAGPPRLARQPIPQGAMHTVSATSPESRIQPHPRWAFLIPLLVLAIAGPASDTQATPVTEDQVTVAEAFDGRLRIVRDDPSRVRVEVNGKTTCRAVGAKIEILTVGGTPLAFVEAEHDEGAPGSEVEDEMEFSGSVLRVYQDLPGGVVLLTKNPIETTVGGDTEYHAEGFYEAVGGRLSLYWWGSDMRGGCGCNAPFATSPLKFRVQVFKANGSRRMVLQTNRSYHFGRPTGPLAGRDGDLDIESSPRDPTFHLHFKHFLDTIANDRSSALLESNLGRPCLSSSLCSNADDILGYIRKYMKIGDCPTPGTHQQE